MSTMDDLLQAVRNAMRQATIEGSELGEAGLDLEARRWLAAADAVNMMVGGTAPAEPEPVTEPPQGEIQ